MQFCSPDSKSQSFDHRANGYGRGEGVGVLVLKRLSDALKSNDTIRAVVRATGSNQDGRTPGITQPSSSAQEQLIKETYAKADLDMSVTRFVEAHGTGTPVSKILDECSQWCDQVQRRASRKRKWHRRIDEDHSHPGARCHHPKREFREAQPSDRFPRFESRCEFVVEVRQLASLTAAQLCTEPLPWPSSGLRRASVSSFGYGGSNAHVVLDDAYNYLKLYGLHGNHWTIPDPTARTPKGLQLPLLSQRIDQDGQACTKHLLVWSAADQDGIKRMATAFSEYARARSGLPEEDKAAYLQHMAYTLCERRSHFSWRSFAVVENLGDVANKLTPKTSRPIKRLTDGKLGFVFTGQGAQYAQMGQELLSCPVFLDSLRRSEQILKKLGAQWSLIDKLCEPAAVSSVNEPAFSQPLCTVIQIGLIDILKSLNVFPSVVLGHSSGEIAAAYAAGGLSQDSACKVAYFRGLCANDVLAQEATPMAMISVGLSESATVPWFDQVQQHFGHVHIVVACINGPDNVTVSGSASQVDWLQAALAAKEIFAQKLRVNIAYHSPMMKSLADRYFELMGELEEGTVPTEPIVMVSSVTGELTSLENLKSPHYWVENMVQPVQFSTALTKACSLKRSTILGSKAIINDIIEIGPHSALQGPIKATLKLTSFKDVGYFPSLVRTAPAIRSVLQLCGNIFAKGYSIDLGRVSSDLGSVSAQPMVLPDLPNYVFDHSRKYWHESKASIEGFRKRKFPQLDLLGAPASDWNPLLARWTNTLRISELPWITDHKINGAILYPAAGMLVMALEGAKQLANPEREVSGYLVKDVVFARALAVSETGTRTELVLQPAGTSSQLGKDAWSFRLCSDVSDGEWQETCSGQVQVHYDVAATDTVDAGKETLARQASERKSFQDVQKQCSQRMKPEHAYSLMASLGAQYGPAFQGIREIGWDGKGNGIAEVSVYEWPNQAKTDYHQEHIIHPTTLDSMIQPCFICMSNGMQADMPVMIPTRLGSLWLGKDGISHPSLETAKVHVQASLRSSRTAEVNLVAAATVPGETLLSASGLELTAVGLNDMRKGQTDVGALCYDMLWKPDLDMMDSLQLTSYCSSARPSRPDASLYYEKLNHVIMMFLSDKLPKDIPAAQVGRPSHQIRPIEQPAGTSSQLGKDAWSFRLCSDVSDGEWQETCSGQVQVHYDVAATDTVDAGKETLARQASERKSFQDVQKQCSQRMKPEHAYSLMASLGAQYGPAFQGIREIGWDGKGNGIAEVSVYEWPNQAKTDYHQEHIIHPTTLDSMIQPCFICMSNGMQADMPVMIPTRLGSLWLGKDGISHPSLETAKVHVQASLRSSRTAEVNLVAAATVPGETLLSASGLELTAVGLNDMRKGQTDVGALCYDMLWKPDLDMMDSLQLTSYCSSARPSRPDASLYYEKLNHVIMMFLSDKLPKDIPAGMPAYLQRYLSWARHYQQAFETGTLDNYPTASSSWKAFSSDPTYRAQVLEELEATPQGKFYIKVGTHLQAILEGTLDPLELLFRDRTVTEFYEDINQNVICYEPLVKFFDLLSHKNPALEILEIGAGTGSTTDHILSMLESEPNADGTIDYTMFSHYDYTDVSPAFFEKATTKYARHSARMRYFVYDMEKDPASQKISLGTYDVIIAGSCLHITEDMDSTIRNVRKLLKPGGKLVFYEPVKEQVRVAFAFGLLPGWWLGKNENRRLRPWLNRKEWDELLSNTGFSGVELEIPDYEDERCHELSFMVATALPDPQSHPHLPPVSILVGGTAEQENVASALQNRLRTSGYDCVTAPFESVVSEDQLGERTWVSLCELGHPVLSNLDESLFKTVKKLLLGARQILWVTSGGQNEGQDPRLHVIDGLARTATTEDPRLTFITLALQSSASDDLESIVDRITKVLGENLDRIQRDKDSIEPEYREVDDLLHINRATVAPRVVEADVDGRKNEERSIHRPFGDGPPIKQGSFNLIDGFQFVVDPDHENALPSKHIETKVHSTGLNFRDYLVAIGQVDEDLIGVECAGTVTRVGDDCGPYRVGDRVAAITSSFQTYTQTHINRACLIPENVAFQDACASLIVYATAYYCLAEIARLRKGESILIHSAAGGTGQASIQIAQHFGAEIYVTVGTLEKRKFLRETFGIPEDHIFSSRNQSFAQGLKRQTQGRGVDVILNSLSGENLVASWESLAPVSLPFEFGGGTVTDR
nr:reducing polyketide synthase fub1 [Quercus suber]